MADCIFCKIIKGEIPSFKVWENDESLAILDINPNTKGMTLVLTKKHYDSYIFDLPEDVYSKFLIDAKRVVKILEKGLNVQRVAMVMEGMGVNHAHIKLYPLYGLEGKFTETWAKEKIFLEKYSGYITTQLGPQADFEELKQLAEKLRNA